MKLRTVHIIYFYLFMSSSLFSTFLYAMEPRSISLKILVPFVSADLSYQIVGDLDSIVMNVKRRLVKKIALEKGQPYTSADDMDHDAQKLGLKLQNGKILLHEHDLCEYLEDIISSNNLVTTFKKDKLPGIRELSLDSPCDNCWMLKKERCRHVEGCYPFGDVMEIGHCDHCFGDDGEICTCDYDCPRGRNGKCERKKLS